jgi:hypothetical protein
LIHAAMKRGDLGAFRPVEASVLAGAALVWLAWEENTGRIAAAAVTEIAETEWRKVCVLVACGSARPAAGPGSESGAGVRDWRPLLEDIEAYARAAGCAAMRIMGRKGWARVLSSYKAKRIILEKDL